MVEQNPKVGPGKYDHKVSIPVEKLNGMCSLRNPKDLMKNSHSPKNIFSKNQIIFHSSASSPVKLESDGIYDPRFWLATPLRTKINPLHFLQAGNPPHKHAFMSGSRRLSVDTFCNQGKSNSAIYNSKPLNSSSVATVSKIQSPNDIKAKIRTELNGQL